jgi:glycine oxidase
VGGGITGAFAAYSLASRGAGVALIERDEIGRHASGNNPGGLNPLHGAGIPGAMQALALEAFRLHGEHRGAIERLSGADFSARRAARLQLAMDDSDVDRLELTKELYDSTPGFSARWIEREELDVLEAGLSPAVRRGLWTEGHARVDPAAYTGALARAAERLGARIVEGEVTGLESAGARVTGVALRSGVIGCDGVVIASGPWCEGPARWLGVPIPVEPVKGEMLLLHTGEGGGWADLGWRDAAVYRVPGGSAWLGVTQDRAGFDLDPTPEARQYLRDRVARFLPWVERAEVVRQTAGLRPVTPDGIPIVGLAPGWENAFLAVGSGRKGVLYSAAMGQAAADLLLSGDTALPVEPCSPERGSLAAPEVAAR